LTVGGLFSRAKGKRFANYSTPFVNHSKQKFSSAVARFERFLRCEFYRFGCKNLESLIEAILFAYTSKIEKLKAIFSDRLKIINFARESSALEIEAMNRAARFREKH
jgi:hypothetical protein